MFPRGEGERKRCYGKYHGLVWADLKALSPKAAPSHLLAATLGWLTAPVLTVCISALQSSPAYTSQLVLHLSKTGAAVLRAVGRIGNETVKGSLNERPERPGLGEQEFCVWEAAFGAGMGCSWMSCLVRQMCRIFVVDQSRGAVDEKAGNSLGHFTEVVVRLPAKHP